MISRDEVLMGRDVEFPLSDELEANLTKLLEVLNKIRVAYNIPMTVSSGYRPSYYNTQAGGATHSNHLYCLACDFHDPNGAIDAWLSDNQDLLEEIGAWQELPVKTQGWAHIDISTRQMMDRPNALKRQFIP